MPLELPQRDAGFARAIAGETLRRFGQLDALLREFLSKTPPPHKAGPTLEILLAGACELLFLGVPSHAAVDAANRLAANDRQAVHFRPLINAVLRKIAREGASVLERQDAERLNTPDWLWERWCDQYGEATVRSIVRAHAIPPPLDINTRNSDVAGKFDESACLLPGGILRIARGGAIELLPEYDRGTWFVQDFAASLPARLLGDVHVKTVIDLCAAPGGKTFQLAWAGAEVLAVERDPERLARMKANLERLHLSATLIECDLQDYAPSKQLDRVLLDAPCSATGTIRRHPELPWIKSAADIQTSASYASELLDIAADMVAADGILVFAVCSLEREECGDQIEDFLRRHANFCRVPVRRGEIFDVDALTPAGDLRTLPCHLAEEGGMDGFYAARLRRLR